MYPTSPTYRLLADIGLCWLLAGTATIAFLHHRRHWLGWGWTLLVVIFWPVAWLLLGWERGTSRPRTRR